MRDFALDGHRLRTREIPWRQLITVQSCHRQFLAIGHFKRVVSMTGAYGLRNYTIKDLRDLKGVRQLVQTNPESPEEAAAAEEAGIDAIKMR